MNEAKNLATTGGGSLNQTQNPQSVGGQSLMPSQNDLQISPGSLLTSSTTSISSVGSSQFQPVTRTTAQPVSTGVASQSMSPLLVGSTLVFALLAVLFFWALKHGQNK